TVHAHVMGAGCSEAHVVVEYDGHVFVGDLVANRNHSWLEIGQTGEWQKRLRELIEMNPRYVHPGRGLTGGPDLLLSEHDYLRSVAHFIFQEQPTQLVMPDDALARITEEMVEAYPDYGFPVFLSIGLPAEWRNIAILLRDPKPSAR